ncbi:MAG: hypothetical protein A2X36_14340 [Elusimicrobia bacterium GWA2_69_24]|nr:MAG: hypothetical protein A2X36_14340 [Elusimicrobia bacterium GWA2_69_24]
MTIHLTCSCGTAYELKDEYAGMLVKCPKCQAHITVPGTPPAPAPHPDGMDPVFQQDKFLLRQKHFAIAEKYVIWDESGAELLHIERPAMLGQGCLSILAALLCVGLGFYGTAKLFDYLGTWSLLSIPVVIVGAVWVFVLISPKRHVTFYRDEQKTEPLLEVLQDQKFAVISATFTVRLMDGSVLARLSKNYLYNVFRKRWLVLRPDGSLWATAKEDSIILSLLRRLLGNFFGILRTNFVILRADSEDLLGEFNRKFTILDRYVLDMSRDSGLELDRRVALALGVMLDTGEKR